MPDEHRPEYQENILLVLLLVAGLAFAFRDLQILSVIVILTAIAVYYDARNIHAGRNFAKESILGNVVTWRPISWGVLVLVGWIIILAIYLFSRKEIFHANN
jgi:type II secretory pathway component PulL